MIVLGQPGVGKSTVCNYLVDGYDSKRFQSSKACVGGFTREIQVDTNYVLGGLTKNLLKVIDLPGFGDHSINLKTMVWQLKNQFSPSERIDVCIIVTKAIDYRITLQELTALSAIKNFLGSVKPDSIFCCITHCDLI
jgi:septin family protein